MTLTQRTTAFAMFAALLGASTPARAQTSVGLSLGMFAPMGRSLIHEVGGLGGAPVPYPVLEQWQAQALVLAFHAGRRFTPRYGLEVKIAQAPGSVNHRDSLNHVSHTTGYMFMAGIRMPIRINSLNSPFVAQLAPGVQMIHRGGRAWAGVGGRSDPALSLSLVGGGLFGRRSKFSSRVELEGHVSYAQFDAPGYGATNRRLVPELLATFGFDYRFKRR